METFSFYSFVSREGCHINIKKKQSTQDLGWKKKEQQNEEFLRIFFSSSLILFSISGPKVNFEGTKIGPSHEFSILRLKYKRNRDR